MNELLMGKNRIPLFFVAVIIVVVGLFTTGCHPGGYVTIENQSPQKVKIYVTHVRPDGNTDGLTYQGSVIANSTWEFSVGFVDSWWVNRIVATDPSEVVLFSGDYTMGDLDRAGWKIVIPPD